MSDDIKPQTTLKASIVTIGTDAQMQALIEDLRAEGFLKDPKGIVLEYTFYDEEEGREARDDMEKLLGRHHNVFHAKSSVAFTTKRAPEPLTPPFVRDSSAVATQNAMFSGPGNDVAIVPLVAS